MIHIARTAEPAALAATRERKLAAARSAKLRGGKVDFDGYDVVKGELAAMQHNKCCYCEKREEQAKYRDVEHYRPKSLYWWLAWTWENLLFICKDCNSDHKRNHFPLESEDARLIAEQSPPGDERPLVLDPSAPLVDPTLEIEFRRVKIDGRERWVPYGLTDRGRTPIEVCGLDRGGLLDLYNDHVNNWVRPKLAPLFEAHRAKDAKTMFEVWDRAKRGLLARGQQFRALSYDALRELVPPSVREQYRLTLERPAP